MTALDWGILAFTLIMALWGYAQGLIVGFLSLAGFALGALVGSRVAPRLLEDGSSSPYAPLVALVGALLVGGILASGLELLGFRLRGRLGQSLGVIDGMGGAALVACLGLALAWVGGAVALNTPGARDLRPPIQSSSILTRLNEALPPSGPLLQTLARFDPFPTIAGPDPGVRAPDSAIGRDPQVRTAARSVVRVLGTACGLGVQGSGWVAGEGLVVTNAHVVAGQDDTSVQVGGRGPRRDAQAVYFDARNDLALLRVPGIGGVPVLPTDEGAPPGTNAAVLGFPENGPYDVEPARLGRTRTVLSQDALGRGPTRRRITALRGLVRSGNSGGPVVDGAGRVVTTVFAAARRSGSGSGFGVPDSIVLQGLGRVRGPVDTGPCSR
ncbi:MAG: MarP family serine protease [Thermoleophilaceae bacterium]